MDSSSITPVQEEHEDQESERPVRAPRIRSLDVLALAVSTNEDEVEMLTTLSTGWLRRDRDPSKGEHLIPCCHAGGRVIYPGVEELRAVVRRLIEIGRLPTAAAAPEPDPQPEAPAGRRGRPPRRSGK